MPNELNTYGKDMKKYLTAYEEVLTEEERIIAKQDNIVVREGNHRVFIDNQADEISYIYDVNTTVIKGDNKIQGIITTLEDKNKIDELENKIAEMKDLKFMGELAAEAAHEIKNPLFSIRGYAQFLENSLDIGDRKREYIKVMLTELDRLNRLVEALLGFSKKDDRRQKISIGEIISDVLTLYKQRFELGGITFNKRVEDEYYIIGAKDQLKQVLINLTENALEAVGTEGKIDLNIYRQQNRVFIEVKDSGPGIQKENKQKIFEPFFTTKQNGSGLGLYICKKIVEDHGGVIRVESNEGQGTSFFVELPLAAYENDKTEDLG
jgi:signal transduction histidine kinase